MHNKLFNYFNFFIKLLLGHLKDVMKKISFYNLHWAEEWQETFRLVFWSLLTNIIKGKIIQWVNVNWWVVKNRLNSSLCNSYLSLFSQNWMSKNWWLIQENIINGHRVLWTSWIWVVLSHVFFYLNNITECSTTGCRCFTLFDIKHCDNVSIFNGW